MIGACSSGQQAVESEPVATYLRDVPEDWEIPDFERMLESVRLIRSIAYYRQANFDSTTSFDPGQPGADMWSEADTVSVFTREASGTGTILQYSDGRIAILTAAHVVGFPDTVATYYIDNGVRTGVNAMAVKVRQENFVADLGEIRRLELLASDPGLDIAVLGQSATASELTPSSLTVRAGSASDLDWGSHVYVMGYPAGYAMMTSGLVSQPGRSQNEGFLLDIPFNRGMSGAPVIAHRGDPAVFEWVGMVTSGAAGSEYLLVPEVEQAQRSIESGEPFTGEAFASHFRRLRHGVTIAVSIEAVIDLIERNRPYLRSSGYTFEVDNLAGTKGDDP